MVIYSDLDAVDVSDMIAAAVAVRKYMRGGSEVLFNSPEHIARQSKSSYAYALRSFDPSQ